MNKKYGTILIIALCLFPILTSAATLYVDQRNTSGICDDTRLRAANTISTPWCTITRANDQHQPGDTVYILPGEYRDYILPKSGSDSSHYTVYSGYGNKQDVKLLGSDQVTNWVRCTPADPNCAGVNTNVWYANFNVQNPTRMECYTLSGGTPPCSPYVNEGSYYNCRSGNAGTSHGTDCFQDRQYWLLRADLSGSRFDASLDASDITAQGMYYYNYNVGNPQNSRLYLWPQNSVDPNSHNIECSVRRVGYLMPHNSPGASNQHYITIQNLTIMHSALNGISLDAYTNNFNITNNILEFNSGGGTCADNPAAIYHAREQGLTFPNINVVGNIIHDQGSDKGWGIKTLAAFSGAGVEFYSVRDSLVANNLIYSVTGPLGAKVDSTNITWKNNTMYDYGSGIHFMNTINNMIIEGNTMYNSNRLCSNECGAILWRGNGGNGQTNNFKIYQNTFKNITVGIYMDYENVASFGHSLYNNLFYSVDKEMQIDSNPITDYSSDYNLFDSITGGPVFTGTSDMNLAQWQSFTGEETHPIIVSNPNPPIFISPSSVYLSSNSPAIDAGIIIPGYHCSVSDSNGGLLLTGCRHWSGSAPDIGAFEYPSAAPSGICEATGGGHCYYVASDGNDANNGSFNAPYKTFSPAINRAIPADFIYARGGVYGYDNTVTYIGDGATRRTFILLQDPARNGAAGSPITIKNYPGERPILNFTDSRLDVGVNIVHIEETAYWTIQGFEMIGGIINMPKPGDGNLTHDIIIRDNEIHDVVVDDGWNPGLIRIDEADINGKYNIYILNNTLHDIYNLGHNGDWANTAGSMLTGAVTVMSREGYSGYSGGGTGYIEIANNTLYRLPQTFFFKNPMRGPIEIHDNRIYNSGNLGMDLASNVHFIHNTVLNVTTGFNPIGTDHYNFDGWNINDPVMKTLNGQNIVVENNTFVGLDVLFGVAFGTGHRVKNNIFFGLTGRRWGSGQALIIKTTVYPDPSDPAQSILQNITSDNNCLITPYADFLHTKRESIDYFNRTEALATFRFDPNSVVLIQSDPAQIFVNPGANNFHLINPNICPGMGYYANESNATSCSQPQNNPPCNCINSTELANTINAWYNGQITINQVITNMKLWKQNSSC